jgi:hypothetical protein
MQIPDAEPTGKSIRQALESEFNKKALSQQY